MNYKGHLTVGSICSLLLTAIVLVVTYHLPDTYSHLLPFSHPLSLEDFALGLMVCLFASLAPDLDHKHSKIHRWSYTGAVSLGIALYLFTRSPAKAAIFTVSLLLIIFALSKLKHRGVTHHLPGVAVFTTILYSVLCIMDIGSSYVMITLYGVVGYLSHICADYCSTWLKRRKNKSH